MTKPAPDVVSAFIYLRLESRAISHRDLFRYGNTPTPWLAVQFLLTRGIGKYLPASIEGLPRRTLSG